MKKKCVIIMAAFLLFLVTACGSSDDPASSNPPPADTTPSATSSTTPETEGANDSETVIAEATTAYEAFIAVVEHMDGDAAYDSFFLQYGDAYVEKHAERYAEYTGGIVDDWYSMKVFDRFLWQETYLRPLEYLYSGNYSYYFDSEDDFVAHALNNTMTGLSRIVGDNEAEAYKTIILWQYDFIINRATVYNFITGQTYAEIVQD